MAVVGMKQLLEAGVHFGHPTRRWNPKMKPYIYTERNSIHILDLQKTVGLLDKAYAFVEDVTRNGGKVLFVGTKKQAQDAVAEEATRAEQFYVNQRWLGGLLTNFQTIQQRLKRLDELEKMKETGSFDRLPKKEQLKLNDQITKLTRMLGGIRGMRRLPDVLFIVDTKKEHIAIHEAHRLDIPVVALLDTNSDPDEVDYPIPANDDAIRAVRLLSSKIADAAFSGLQERQSTMAKEEVEADPELSSYEGGYTADPEGYDASIDAVDHTDVESSNGAAPDAVVADEPAASPEASVVNPVDAEASVANPVDAEAPTSASSDVEESPAETDAAVSANAASAEAGAGPAAADEAQPGVHPDAAE